MQQFALTQKMQCGLCGSMFHRHRVNHKNCWFCYQHRENRDLCSMGNVYEEEIYESFLTVYHKLLDNRQFILKPLLEQLLELQGKTTFAKPEFTDIQNQIANLTRQNHTLARLQSKGCMDSAFFIEKSNHNNKQIEELRQKLQELQKPDNLSGRIDQTRLILELLDKTNPMLEFDPTVFKSMVHKIIVFPQKFCFQLINGLILEEKRD
jgi:site-specific DNA recombinase